MPGRVCVVTGAGQGIGRAVAVRLAAADAHVVVVDANGEAAEKVAAEVGGSAYECDVAQPAAVRALAETLDRADVLVNNAGIWRLASLAETTPEHFRAVMETNVLGTLLCIQALAPVMAAGGGGAVVNLSSIVATQAHPRFGIYPASKAAIIALTQQAAIEYAGAGIRVNAVGPGLIRTEGTAALFGEPDQVAALEQLLPLGRLGAAADVAEAVAFLASDAARYITGEVLFADGGLGQATFALLWRSRAERAGR
jgi:NAD(P)-dependent dehydrogenase (short-subunit alcohol dehydrogenase family)